ncbi:hypothetical protein HYW59_02100 [Candidatus Kaiserbacteria bacterium]|nr:hypothetical protein [Candidatus Kaiserbacteria bacterium]
MFENRAVRWLRRGLILIVLAPSIAFAQIPTIVPEHCRAGAAKTCGICDIAQLAQNTINAGIYIAIFLAAFLFAYAGWQYITAGGDSGKATNAKKIFWTVGVGLVLILAAWLIVDIIMKTLVSEGALFGPWNEVC